MGVVRTFLLPSIISLLSSSLGDGSILTEILPQGPLDPKQPTKCYSLAAFLTTQKMRYAGVCNLKAKIA